MAVALADARARFDIPAHALAALIDGGLQDTEQSRYASFDDLRGYCEKVAGAVGVACVAVYGSDDVDRARTLGIALQLINIMRDVAEDWELGRVYLPQDELAVYGVTEDDIAQRRVTPAWRSLMEFQADRARAHLAEGLKLLDSLDRRSALCVSTFAGLYSGQLDRIEANGFDVFGPSCRLSTPAKLVVVARRASSDEGAVVGGGLAGLTAALDLVDGGAEVTLVRSAADARRRRADAARARRRSRAAARQRPAHRARLLRRVPALPRPDRRVAARCCAHASRCR